MKKSRLALLGSGIAIALMAITGQHALAKSKFSTYWYQSRTTGVTSITGTDCDGINDQCTIITSTKSPSVSHNLFKNQQLTTPALHN